MDSDAILRIARPSDDLDALLSFYRDGLGLDLALDQPQRPQTRWSLQPG